MGEGIPTRGLPRSLLESIIKIYENGCKRYMCTIRT